MFCRLLHFCPHVLTVPQENCHCSRCSVCAQAFWPYPLRFWCLNTWCFHFFIFVSYSCVIFLRMSVNLCTYAVQHHVLNVYACAVIILGSSLIKSLAMSAYTCSVTKLGNPTGVGTSYSQCHADYEWLAQYTVKQSILAIQGDDS